MLKSKLVQVYAFVQTTPNPSLLRRGNDYFQKVRVEVRVEVRVNSLILTCSNPFVHRPFSPVG